MVKKLRVKKKKRKSKPRGDCFILSFNLAIDLERDRDLDDVYIVHGIPTLRDERTLESTGTRYGHAWIEFGDVVFDSVANMMVCKNDYYREGNIDPDEVVRYTPEEARALVCEHEHYGPWDERFDAEDIVYGNRRAKK